jgi:hypothetical protein
MTYAIISGCSHTAGVGIDIDDCYVSLIEKHYEFPVLNWGVPSGGCTDVLIKIINAVKDNNKPKFIVAQWPNPFRKQLWINGKLHLQNINSSDDSFRLLLKHSEENFYEPWMQAIIVGNLLCKLADIQLINILLEDIDQVHMDRLQKENIQLHTDKKLPGQTWFFDNKAQDGIHHSPWCHKKWAERLIGIINEHSTR